MERRYVMGKRTSASNLNRSQQGRIVVASESVRTSAIGQSHPTNVHNIATTYKMDLNVIIPVLLFVLLSPGVLLSLPPGAGRTTQVLTHAVVFGAVYWSLRKTFPQYY